MSDVHFAQVAEHAVEHGSLRVPRGQMAVLGGVFFCVFFAYDMIQGYAAQLYGATLAANCEAALYASFTASCVAAPAIVDSLGSRVALFVGALCYAGLALASLGYASAGAPPALRPLVVGAGALVGAGASLLWTAQGRVMLAQRGGAGPGGAFALFWGLFNASAVAGGLVSWGYFSRSPLTPGGEAPLFGAFGALTFVGALGAFALRPLPSDARWRTHARARTALRSPCAAARFVGTHLLATVRVLSQAPFMRASPLWLATGIAPA